MPQVPLSRLRRLEQFRFDGVMCVFGKLKDGSASIWSDRCGFFQVAKDTLVTVTDELYAEIQRRENEHP